MYLLKIVRSEGLGVKVIVEAVLYCGAYRKLGLGMHPLYGLSQYMAACVAHGPAAVLIVPCEKLELMVAVYRPESVLPAAVYLGGKGGLFEPWAYRLGYLQRRHAVLKLLDGAIGECDVHGVLLKNLWVNKKLFGGYKKTPAPSNARDGR